MHLQGEAGLVCASPDHVAVALAQVISFSLVFSRLEKLLQLLSVGLCSSPHPTERLCRPRSRASHLCGLARKSLFPGLDGSTYTNTVPFAAGLCYGCLTPQTSFCACLSIRAPKSSPASLFSTPPMPTCPPARCHAVPGAELFLCCTFTVLKYHPVSAACQGPSAQPCCPGWLGLRTQPGAMEPKTTWSLLCGF